MSSAGKSIGAAVAAAAGWLARGRPIDGARVRRALWPITQTAVAAGLAYFIAHSLIGHVQPFFAPIAATVSMSTTTDLRAQRAVQLIAGVLLGIGIGVGVAALLGHSAAAVGAAVFVELCVALAIGRGFIAEGALFFNQAAIAGILILTVHTNAESTDRLIDALIGGGVALVFSLLLFPADPDSALRRASQSVFAACERELRWLDESLTRPPVGRQAWLLPASQRIGRAVDGFDRARATAREIVRLAPARRSAKAAVARADRSAADFVALTSAILTLGSLIVAAVEAGQSLPAELRDSITVLRAALATAAADGDLGAERALPASASNAAVIASLAARCAALTGHAANPSPDPGANPAPDPKPR